MKMHNDTSQSGISLLEIIIVIAIVGIAAAIAVPNVQNWAQSRTINNDLASIQQVIEFSRSQSSAQGRVFYIIGPTGGTLNVRYATGNNLLECPSWSTVKSMQYPGGIIPDSTVLTKHGDGTPGTAGVYNGTNTTICFFPDGTSSGGGFQLAYKGDEYRIDIFITGFYDIRRNLNSACPEDPATTWCERN